MGGYREGSGRSKSGYDRGIYCGSTYELCWVIYNLDHGIEFSRFPGKLEKDGVSYYPDFLIGDMTIVETKGYESTTSVDRKTKVAESFGYTVIVLRKDDLQYAFSYVAEKYKTKRFYELYDNYKPKFTLLCDCCTTEFQTDKAPKTKTKFCSRSCAGKYQKRTINMMTDDLKKRISESLKGSKQKGYSYSRKYKQIWITNGETNTRIPEGSEIPSGFRRGRTV